MTAGYTGRRTLGALLDHRAAERGDATFVWWRDERLSYRELADRAARACGGFAELGVGAGDVVALLLDNGPEFLAAWFGLARLGAVEAPVNTAYKGWQLESVLAETGAATLVVDAARLPAVLPLLPRVPGIRTVVVVGEAEADEAASVALVPWTAVAAGPSVPEAEVRPSDPVAIMLTSGTTSASKGVLLCHEHELTVAEVIGGHLRMDESDVFYNYFPLFHNASQAMITLSALRFGASMVLTDRFSVRRFWPDVQRHGCTLFFCMGPMVDFLLAEAGAAPARDDHTLRMGWGIGYGESQAARFAERFGVPLLGGYGATEIGMVTLHPHERPRLETAGTPLPHAEVQVVDADDRPLPVGEVGEIVVRPRRPYVTTLGYHNRPAETVALMRNCWVHTGDAGRFDEEGYLHFVDRIKDVIRRRGENISSFEIEAVVTQIPAVLECAAVAVPSGHGRHDDEVYLAVVAEPGQELDPAKVVAYCADQLAYFAVPRYVEVWDELPKTPTGKIRKTEIRGRGVGPHTWDRNLGGSL
ncbi:AMP-binding protein [Jiangella anatolica]|uniref:ATP-dependent acyl-CoA ligase n=1 Tax=Jiangella anatolica TaxID=2670374 RepID=A0A2W2BB57_9ACTN|nr:AMP-binding protein [Jiangella anatolica]PZF83352.1 ATP-dependent acyl-CoA ligase [Jiangella anatolica]